MLDARSTVHAWMEKTPALMVGTARDALGSALLFRKLTGQRLLTGRLCLPTKPALSGESRPRD